MSDLIERQAAIRWVKTECNPYGKPTLEFESGKKVIEHLERMPSAQRKGKWDTFFSDSYKVHEIGVECSCCGYRTQERTTYCPNCGARMVEGDDEVIYREVVFTDKGIPTTEAELMIYCKNCKHFEQFAEGWNRCCIYGTSVRPDDYCSIGERREDE